jgi:hypothetical protein
MSLNGRVINAFSIYHQPNKAAALSACGCLMSAVLYERALA